MNAAQFVAAKLAEFDALPERERVASVTLTDYKTEEQWRKAPEQFCTLAEAQEINGLLAEGLQARGVEVKWVAPGQDLSVAMTIAGATKRTIGSIGWAVFRQTKEKL